MLRCVPHWRAPHHQAEAGAIYTHSQLIKVQKHFIYLLYGFVKHSEWSLRLNHDVITSDRSVPTPKFLKIYARLSGFQAKAGAIYTHSQPFKVQKHFIYIYIYDVDL